jgi:hypothetical protein
MQQVRAALPHAASLPALPLLTSPCLPHRMLTALAPPQPPRPHSHSSTKRRCWGPAPHPTNPCPQSSRSFDEDVPLSIRLLGADITGPLTFVLLLAGGWHAWNTDLIGRLTGRQGFGRRGRWVYDRSLGGKKVREGTRGG